MYSVSLSSMHLCFLSLWGSIKDYYKVLGVDPAASSKEIGKAQLPKFLLNQVGDGIVVNWIPAWKSMLLQLFFSILFFVVVSDDILAWESLFGSWHNFHVHSAHGHCSVERGLSSVGSQGVGTNETNVERSCVDLELFQELSVRSCRHAWFPFRHIHHPRYILYSYKDHIRGFGVLDTTISPHLDLVAHWLVARGASR